MYIERYIMKMKPMSQINEERDPMVRIADALEEILRLVKEDQERSRKYMEDAAAHERQAKG